MSVDSHILKKTAHAQEIVRKFKLYFRIINSTCLHLKNKGGT